MFSSSIIVPVLQFPIPFIIVALLILLPPNGNSDRGSHSRLFAFLPTTVRALHFYLKKDTAFSPFRRLASNCAYSTVPTQDWALSTVGVN